MLTFFFLTQITRDLGDFETQLYLCNEGFQEITRLNIIHLLNGLETKFGMSDSQQYHVDL